MGCQGEYKEQTKYSSSKKARYLKADTELSHMDASSVIIERMKRKSNQTWLTVRGDKINYPKDCGRPTADLLTMKLLLNSVISTHKAKFMIMDTKNFYFNTPLKRYKCLQLKLDDIPKDVTKQYMLEDKTTDDVWVYEEI